MPASLKSSSAARSGRTRRRMMLAMGTTQRLNDGFGESAEMLVAAKMAAIAANAIHLSRFSPGLVSQTAMKATLSRSRNASASRSNAHTTLATITTARDITDSVRMNEIQAPTTIAASESAIDSDRRTPSQVVTTNEQLKSS